MPSKVQLYAQMADRTAEQITGSYQKWTAFRPVFSPRSAAATPSPADCAEQLSPSACPSAPPDPIPLLAPLQHPLPG